MSRVGAGIQKVTHFVYQRIEEVNGMPAITTTKCKSCGRTHKVCLSEAELFFASSRYDFVCPRTKELVEFQPANEGWHEAECEDHVRAHEVVRD